MSQDASEGSISRRHLLVVAAGSAALTACGGMANPHADAATDSNPNDGGDAADDAAMTTDAAMCSPTGDMAGMVTDFAMGTWTLNSGLNLIIAHDAGGLYAYTSICTHEGCPVNPPSSAGISYCPCHGSRFDGNGNVLSGVAFRPLEHYAVNVCDGVVYVDSTMTVPASTRTAV
jgi:thiosulfate dehydrogenase [quinone] large subunit